MILGVVSRDVPAGGKASFGLYAAALFKDIVLSEILSGVLMR